MNIYMLATINLNTHSMQPPFTPGPQASYSTCLPLTPLQNCATHSLYFSKVIYHICPEP